MEVIVIGFIPRNPVAPRGKVVSKFQRVRRVSCLGYISVVENVESCVGAWVLSLTLLIRFVWVVMQAHACRGAGVGVRG